MVLIVLSTTAGGCSSGLARWGRMRLHQLTHRAGGFEVVGVHGDHVEVDATGDNEFVVLVARR